MDRKFSKSDNSLFSIIRRDNDLDIRQDCDL